MKEIKYLYQFIIIFMALCSCTKQRFDTAQELRAYVKTKEHGYIWQKTVNGVDFTLTYRPTDLLVNQELGAHKTEEYIDSLRKKYSKYLYFNLSMSKNNQELLNNVAGNRSQFGAMVNQLAFGMGNKVHLYTPKRDTIPLADYSYPRMYGMSGSTTILFVYPRDALKEDHLNLVIGDIGFQTGEVRFKIITELLKNEPELTFYTNSFSN